MATIVLTDPIEAVEIDAEGVALAAMIDFVPGDEIEIEWQGEPGRFGWESGWASDSEGRGESSGVQTVFMARRRIDSTEPWSEPIRYTTMNLPLVRGGERWSSSAITLISAAVGDQVPGVDIASPDSPIDYNDLPADAQAWATEQGFGRDDTELIYVVDGEVEVDGYPTRLVRSLYDAEMRWIGGATAEQVEAAETADGGWIWIRPDGLPVPVVDHDEQEGWLNVGRPGGRTDQIAVGDHRKVCVA
jgi:hypothetical protein